ncbi:6-bladed beta-propeller [Bacteroides fragilis]|jgi:hypothetical protein|uniref:6-bladed beta-propeller n=4 Tax=Bacteroides fragilis TaxID=817 RepID=A0A5C6HDP7_BACFG|nr:6-bladed beta-propeller [Bacteroides fragilis]KAA4741657.1 6-bladed beta-propeller [Bacteroides fragilis]KAA4745459.1 6-bladed beta-propeller [Bacteroides fragilis]KAA4759825.1 6-bladed beta-propeller [Bacteroides fragilis]KAA4761555.1 6-bladed beta-propeller [Bacteroides fragilis]KAA4762577.1 6-bladed beta-propeller [Bacteroides fragilis]
MLIYSVVSYFFLKYFVYIPFCFSSARWLILQYQNFKNVRDMLNRLNYFIMLAGLLVLVACSSNSGKQVEVANTPFVYDGLKEYPVKELKLSDLAVSDYVLLKDDENSLLGRLPTNPCMQVTEDRIYIQDEEQQAIFIFDRQGNPLLQMRHKGGGPQEWASLNSFYVDSPNKEIIVLDWAKKFIVYDLNGKFKRSFPTPGCSWKFANLNDEAVLIYCPFTNRNNGEAVCILSKKDGKKLYVCPITIDNFVWDSEGRIGYEPLKPAYGGILFSDLSLKGVYFIDAETYEVKQVIDEVTEYKFENAEFVKLHPAIDAKDYTLYTTLGTKWLTPDMPMNYYYFDKKEQKMYTLKNETGWAVLKDICNVQRTRTTNTPGIGIGYYWPSTMKGESMQAEKEQFDSRFRAIMDSIPEEGNPVLQIMNFNK